MKLSENLHLHCTRGRKGDCIHIHYAGKSGKWRNIIVDSGPASAVSEFCRLYDSILQSGECVDIMIVTHYDEDHIGALLKMERTLSVGKLCFNVYDGSSSGSTDLSASHAQRLFHTKISGEKITSILAGDSLVLDGAVLYFIAPSVENRLGAMNAMRKAEEELYDLSSGNDWYRSIDELMGEDYPEEDRSVSNRASISFVFEYDVKRILISGDSPGNSVKAGLKSFGFHSFNLVQLPHHGSARNISEELLCDIACRNFLISADGVRHPDKLTVAKLLKKYDRIMVYCNYTWWNQSFLTADDMRYVDDGSLTFLSVD